MNITAQHVAAEELMAFLDGELSAAEAQAVSTHVDDCAECGRLVDELRRTSQELSAWKVAPVPAELEQSITEFVAKAKSGADLGKPNFVVRASFWTGRQYAVVSLGTVSALLILAAIVTPNLLHERAPAVLSSPTMAYMGPEAGKGTLGKLQTYGGSASKGQHQGSGIVGGVAGGIRGGRIGSGRGTLGKLQADDQVTENSDGQPQVVHEQVENAPMIARTVSISIVVKDFAASRSSLDTILARYRGYSAQLNVSTVENAPRTLQASLRIPAPALSSAVNDLKALGRVENESQSGEEVTRQHADLVARLKNSRDTEQRLRDILQQRTGKVSEVLQVEREIARVRGEIESMDAEQKALEHRVDFATVELQLTEEYKAQLNPPAPSVTTRVHNAFVAGYHNAAETVLGIVLFFAEYVPALFIWLAILASPFILLWRRYRKIRALPS